jgi:hypothetical protein
MVKLKWLGVSVVIITIMMGLASGAPLEVNVEEKVSTFAEYDGSGFTYATNVTGYINITNTGSDDLYDIWVAINLQNAISLSSSFDNSSSGFTIYSGSSKPPTMSDRVWNNINKTNVNYYVHIPHLKQNELVSLFYDVNDTALGIDSSSLFLIDEKYNVSKVPANRAISWRTYLNISMNDTIFNSITGTQTVSMSVNKYLSQSDSDFGSSNWTTLGPISNPQTQNGGSPTTSLFDSPYSTGGNDGLLVESITLSEGGVDYVNISFTVTGNDSITVNRTNYILEPFGFATIGFSFDGNVSGTDIVDVFAVGDASIAVSKNGPSQNASGEWVVWKGNATITNKASGLTYILTNVDVWATSGDFSTNIYGVSFTPSQILSPGGSYTTSDMQFEYDGVPVIWANATFKLIKDQTNGWWEASNTRNATNATYGSDFIVVEKIYVIGTYLLKVTKHVIPNATAGDNVFDVYLVVENIGGEKSPYVYIYDMIPDNFTEYNWDASWIDKDDGNWVNKTAMFAGNGSTDNPMSGYRKGYWWRLYPMTAGADGDGSYSDATEINNNQSVVVFYQMNGSGEFKVLDAFIVGLDPMFSMNEQTSPQIKIVTGSSATNYEGVMATASAIIGAIAIMGMVRRK